MNRRRAVGVFDSGIGGLTVVSALLDKAPDTEIVYFGDTARLPYGTKSDATVKRQTLECIHFLTRFDVDMIVVACNTASSIALSTITEAVDVPVIGVVEAGVQAALAATKTGVIGIIGTAATIRAGGYEKRLEELKPGLRIVKTACPLFVPLVEEGWTDRSVTRSVAEEYLSPVLAEGVDTLILGCTHYPLLKETIAGVAGAGVRLIDTGAETAVEVAEALEALEAPDESAPLRHRFFVSDDPERFEAGGTRFLGRTLGQVTLVEQSDLPWFERSWLKEKENR